MWWEKTWLLVTAFLYAGGMTAYLIYRLRKHWRNR